MAPRIIDLADRVACCVARGSKMKVIVHRGSREIGGTCIEISVDETRLLFDAGLPLEHDSAASPSLPATVRGSVEELDGVFLSHAHGDHAGLIGNIPASVPVWMTAETSKMVLAAGLFTLLPGVLRSRIRTMKSGEPISVGSIRVTAMPVDHSIFGAVGFIIEADGKRVVYTGDLRMHGRKPGMARKFIDAARCGIVDLIIVEGTRLGDRSKEANITENDVAAEIANDISGAPGAVLAAYSPLNVDRFVSFYKARGRRTMVIDPYQAFVLHLVNSRRLPDPLRQLAPLIMAGPRFPFGRASRRLHEKAWFKDLQGRLIDPARIVEAPDRYLILYRDSMREWLFPLGLPPETTCIFSYWPGYVREERVKSMRRDVDAAGGRFVLRHASGHAHPDDLFSLVAAISPRRILPVHTTAPDVWARRFGCTAVANDGQEISVT